VQLLFLAPGDVGKGRVEPISWMQTCHAYAKAGLDVRLVTLGIRRRDAVSPDDVWSYYGVTPSFRISVMPTILGPSSSVTRFRFWAGSAAVVVVLQELVSGSVRSGRLVVHARSPVLAAPFAALRSVLPKAHRPVLVLETHALPRSSNGWIVRAADLVVVNSDKLAADLRAEFGLPPNRVLHAPLGPYNAVHQLPKEEARREIGISPDATLACYTGKMTEEHNEFLLQTAYALAPRLPGFRLLLVGGNPEILEWTSRRTHELGLHEAVIIAGFVAPAKVHVYQAASDVLLYHMPSSMGIFDYCTPAKGYEYQATGRPVVATDIPLSEEVFGQDGDRVIRVEDRTPESFAQGVLRALTLEDEGRQMTERASAWVRTRTWESRTEAILQTLEI
jgi:glycosyltransferase involved in cell wall biosynthesis